MTFKVPFNSLSHGFVIAGQCLGGLGHMPCPKASATDEALCGASLPALQPDSLELCSSEQRLLECWIYFSR